MKSTLQDLIQSVASIPYPEVWLSISVLVLILAVILWQSRQVSDLKKEVRNLSAENYHYLRSLASNITELRYAINPEAEQEEIAQNSPSEPSSEEAEERDEGSYFGKLMRGKLGTPSSFARSPNTRKLSPPDYDFANQQRWSDTETGRDFSYTSNSIQTYNAQGKPFDARNDQND